MVHRLVVSYGQPADPAAFDAHYRQTHAPLASAQPGLVRFTFGKPVPFDPAQPAPYLIAELDFDSEEAMGRALTSPEGQAAGQDLVNFATGGATFVSFDVEQAS